MTDEVSEAPLLRSYEVGGTQHPLPTEKLSSRFRRQLHALGSVLAGAEIVPRDQSPPLDDASGRTLGRFRLKRRLGAGGFGVVYLAEDMQLGREVALKLPHTAALLESGARVRFLREIQTAAGLHHPHIVAVYDAGEVDGVLFLAMAYCPGQTLHEWLSASPPVSDFVAAQIVGALADGIQHAHERGVLHRDLKPRNILLDPTTHFWDLPFCPKLTDFSIAKLLSDNTEVTATNEVLGTLRYMAPEQASGQRQLVGPASDVYALGGILYELLTGVSPIQGEDNADTLRRLLFDEPLAPRQRVPGIASDVEAICLKCLNKRPQDRYPTAAALAEDLQRFLAGQPTIARPLRLAERMVRWARKHPTIFGLSLVSTVALSIILLGLTYYNARLSQIGAGLVKANVELELALKEARTAEARATSSEQATQQLLYVSDMRLANRARLEGDARTAADLLSRHVPAPGQADLRGLEWGFLWSQIHLQSEAIAHEPGNRVYQVRLAPDGKRLASVGKDAIVRIYDLRTGDLETSIPTGQGEVNGVSFSPDGDQLATAGDDGTVRVWNRADSRLELSIAAFPKLAFNVVYTPDGDSLIACGVDPSIRIWDVRTGNLLGELREHGKGVEALAVSYDGRWLATAGADAQLCVWNLAERRKLWSKSSRYPGFVFSSVTFSPDASRVAAGDFDNVVRVWDMASTAEIATARHLDKIQAVAFNQGGTMLASADAAGVICLFEISALSGSEAAEPSGDGKTLQPWRRWQTSQARINALTFDERRRLISGGDSGEIVAWDTAAMEATSTIQSDKEGYFQAAFTVEGRLWAQQHGTETSAWNLQCITSLPPSPPLPLDGRLLGGEGRTLVLLTDDRELQFFETTSTSSLNSEITPPPHQPPRLTCHWTLPATSEVREFAFSRDGMLCACLLRGPRNQLCCFDIHAGVPRFVQELPTGSAGPLAMSPDGREIATGVDDEIYLWSSRGGHPRRFPSMHRSLVAATFSPSGHILATGGSDRLIKFWNPQTGACLATLAGHRDSLVSMRFSHNGRSLVSTGTEGTLKVWNVAAGEELFDLYKHHHLGLHDVQISPDDRWLVCTSEFYGRLVLIDLGKPSAPLGLNPSNVTLPGAPNE